MTGRVPGVLALAVIFTCAGAGPLQAQTVPVRRPLPAAKPKPKPKPKLSNKLSIRAEGLIGFEHFTASQTFKGIFDSSNGVIYGGGGEVDKGHLFARVDVTHFAKTGQRAFDLNGQVFRLGLPLKISITPVVGAAGYRGLLSRRVIGYAGAGAGSWSYSETGDDPADSVSLRKTGYLGLGGVEWRVHPFVALGFEAQYAIVPNAIGGGGLSADLHEKDLGGATAAVRVIVGR